MMPQNPQHPQPKGDISKCPYAALAAMGPNDIAKEMKDIGLPLAYLMDQSLNQSSDPLMERCFGSLNLHRSVFREAIRFPEEKTPQGNLPPLASLLGDIHTVYRHEMPKQLALRLNMAKLEPDTVALIRKFELLLRDYRAAVMKTMEPVEVSTPAGKIEKRTLPDFHKIPRDVYYDLQDRASDLETALPTSQLGRHDAIIPVLLGEKEIEVENTGNFGLFVFAFGVAERHLNDFNKLSPEISRFLGNYSTFAANIPTKMNKMLAGDPALKAQWDTVYKQAYGKIRHLLITRGRALQMANLVRECFADNAKYGMACGELLNRVGMKPYPEKLEEARECAITLRTIQSAMDEESGCDPVLTKVFKQCMEKDANPQKPLSRVDAKKAEAELETIIIEHPGNSHLIAQASLAKEFLYLQRLQGLSADTSKNAGVRM